MVLTEERDASRSNEEKLFEDLAERIIDLERLQESYVEMTDRCNDSQDEISDLREQIQTYSEALSGRISQSSSAPNGVINSNSNYTDNSSYNMKSNHINNDASTNNIPVRVAEESKGNIKSDAKDMSLLSIDDRMGSKLPHQQTGYDDDFDDYEDEFDE